MVINSSAPEAFAYSDHSYVWTLETVFQRCGKPHAKPTAAGAVNWWTSRFLTQLLSPSLSSLTVHIFLIQILYCLLYSFHGLPYNVFRGKRAY